MPSGAARVTTGSPIVDDGPPPINMWSTEFSDDPHAFYQRMRDQHGSLVPVEISDGVRATLVVNYATALRILNDPEHFPADPRTWQQTVPADCPILPMLEWRPNALRSVGPEHLRYRAATTAAIDGIDLHVIQRDVEQIAERLLVGLEEMMYSKDEVDLIGGYIFPLVLAVLNTLMGSTPEIGQQVADASAAMFEGVGTENVDAMLDAALTALIDLKRAHPGDDITTRLINHSAGLSDVELAQQLVTCYSAGAEPLTNLIANTLLLMMIDDRFAGGLLSGSLSTRDALDEVLFTDPPLANYCVTYPRQPILLDNRWLPAHQPVVISMAACNTDPAIGGGDITGNRSHLAWSAGPHQCPARTVGYLIAQAAIDQLLDALPDLTLATPKVSWRPGPFHRAMSSLPVLSPGR